VNQEDNIFSYVFTSTCLGFYSPEIPRTGCTKNIVVQCDDGVDEVVLVCNFSLHWSLILDDM